MTDSFSKRTLVTSGVPQGSVLGPLLFTGYINAVSEVQQSPGSKLVLYADDMALVHPLDNDSSIEEIQDDINKLDAKIDNLGISLNVSKCKFQVVALRNNAHQTISLSLKNVQLECVSSYRYLGIELDNRLSFSAHAHNAALKTKRAIGVLNRMLRKWAPKEVFQEAVIKLALPIFFMGSKCGFHQRKETKTAWNK